MKKDKPRIQNNRNTLPTTADSMLQHAEITAHVLFLNWQKQKMLRSTCVILWTLIRQDYSSTRSSSSLAAWSTATRSTPPPARSSSMRRSWITERKDASRCNTAACAFLRVIQDHVQNGGLAGDIAVGVGVVTLKADAFARLNDNVLLVSRDSNCPGEKGYKLGGTPQMWLQFPMAAGSQLHIADGELSVFIIWKKAVRRHIENYQKPVFPLVILGMLHYTDTC